MTLLYFIEVNKPSTKPGFPGWYLDVFSIKKDGKGIYIYV